jgi:hypothetical protein
MKSFCDPGKPPVCFMHKTDMRQVISFGIESDCLEGRRCWLGLAPAYKKTEDAKE